MKIDVQKVIDDMGRLEVWSPLKNTRMLHTELHIATALRLLLAEVAAWRAHAEPGQPGAQCKIRWRWIEAARAKTDASLTIPQEPGNG